MTTQNQTAADPQGAGSGQLVKIEIPDDVAERFCILAEGDNFPE